MAESSAPLIDEADNRKPRETADDYAGTLVEFGGWRIVRCKDDIQWIVQRDARRGCAGRDPRPWRGVAYVVNERFLREVISRPSLGVPATTLSVLLAALPERIKTEAAVASAPRDLMAHHG